MRLRVTGQTRYRSAYQAMVITKPWQVPPYTGVMPEGPNEAPSLEEACAVVSGTPARIRVLRVVMDSTEVTANDVMASTGLSRNATGHHLTALLEAGAIRQRRATHPRGAGPVIYWSADLDVIHAIRDTLSSHLT